MHGDVFRPPRKGMILSVFLGNGVQIFFMTLITLCKYVYGIIPVETNVLSITCFNVTYRSRF